MSYLSSVRLSVPIISIVALALCLDAKSVQAEDSAVAGRDLAERVYSRPDGKDVTILGKMILQEKGRKPRLRVMYTYIMDKAPGDVKSLIRFLTPEDVRNTGLLNIDTPGQANSDQWLYLPELHRVRRISSERKGGRFMGSDVYYEDLQDREVDMDRHKIVGGDEVQGVKCTLLESVPAEPTNSVYSKRVACIHLKSLLPLRIDFFMDNKQVKRAETLKIEKIDGYWSITDQRVTELQSGHSTRTIVDRMAYDRGLPVELFSQQTLEDPAREVAFRFKE